MKHFVKLALAGAVAAFPLFVQPALAQDYKSEYRVSIAVGTTFPWGMGAERWADLVRERTDGRINMKIYPGTSLVGGDQTREFTAMRQGVIDMAVGSTINWSPQVVELNLFSLPFLLPDFAAMDAVRDGEAGKKLFEIIESKDIIPLAWGENGYRELSNSKKEIRTPADLQGLKVRVVGSPLYNDIFTTLGANPTQMSWADTQPALSTGAVDGQENPLGIFTAASLHTIGQDHLTLWGYVADSLIFAVAKDIWESFSPEDQEIVRSAALEAGEYNIGIARKGITEEDSSLLDQIEAEGVKITRLTADERKAFQDAVRPVYDAWKSRIGSELVEAAEQDIAAR